MTRKFKHKGIVTLVYVGAARMWLAGLLAWATTEPQLSYHHWTTENGLPSNTLLHLLQTHDGYIWIGTARGVARFDGIRFKVFADELLFEDGDLRCHDLVEDTEGRVWIRLAAGLVSYDQGIFRKYPANSPPLAGTAIQTMIASSRGGLWIGTRAAGLIRFHDGRFTRRFKTENGLARSWVGILREDANQRLWIGAGETFAGIPELWQRLDPETGTFTPLNDIIGQPLDGVTDIRPGAQGELWIGRENELLCFTNGHLRAFPYPMIGVTGNPGRVVQTDRGEVWFSPPRSEKLIHFANGLFRSFGMEEGLADDDIRPLLWDREGNLWIGYGGGGLQRLTPRSVTSFFQTTADGHSRRQVDSISEGPDSVIWLGTWAGLLRLEKDAVREFLPPVKGHFDAHPVLADHSGQVWLGVRDYGLLRLESNEIVRVLEADDGRKKWTVRVLFEDSQERLWVGSDSGLLEKTGDDFVRYTTRDGLLDEDIRGIREAPDHALWIGTHSGGLHRYHQGKFQCLTTRDGLLSNEANPLLVENDGTLWVRTPLGLNRVRTGAKVDCVTERHGLPDADVFCLLDDGAGYYWANCVRGIFRVRKADLHAVADGKQDRLFCVSYGEAEGASSAEGNGEVQPNATRTSDGKMWFSTTRGVAMIDPARLIKREVPPIVLIEEALADDQLVFLDGSLTRPSPDGKSASTLRLPPRRSHGLEIRYTANSFVAPEKVRFRYRLEGADGQWRDAGARRTAFYTGLEPGAYRFSVEASNREGTWSAQSAELAFIVEPLVIQRRWFPWFCGLMLLAGGAALALWRLRWQRRVLIAEKNATIERERTRIARDLHDDLGTALTGLALELDVIRRDSAKEAASYRRLGQSAQRTRQLAERMREVVWAVNPRCDTVASLASYLEQQTVHFLNSDGISGRLDFPEEIPESPIDAETRHQLTLAVREALTNVVRHSRATEVTLKMRLEEEILLVEVADNGRGFHVDPQPGHGLHNMQHRFDTISGEFICHSAPGGGTVISFRVPLSKQARRNGTAQP